MRNLLIVNLSILLFCSCNYNTKNAKEFSSVSTLNDKNSKIENPNEVLEVDISGLSFPEGEMLLSDVACDVEIVPLETTDASIFNYAKIRNVVIDNENIFVNLGTRILRFSRDGRYILDIGNRGNGPADFLSSSGIGLNAKEQLLYVASNMSVENEIKTYSYDGKYQNTMRVAEANVWLSGDDIHRESRDYCFIKGRHIFRRRLPLTDPKDAIWQVMMKDTLNQLIVHLYDPVTSFLQSEFRKNSGMQIDKVDSYWATYAPVLNQYEEHLNFVFEANDTIYGYDISAERLTTRFIIKSGNQLAKEELYVTNKSQKYFDDAIVVHDVLESKDFLHLIAENKVYAYLLRIDKKSGNVQCKRSERGELKYGSIMRVNYREVDEPEFVNDLCGGLSFYPNHHNAGEWIGIYNPNDLLEKIDFNELNQSSVVLPEKKEELIHLLRVLKEDDNPVVLIVKLK